MFIIISISNMCIGFKHRVLNMPCILFYGNIKDVLQHKIDAHPGLMNSAYLLWKRKIHSALFEQHNCCSWAVSLKTFQLLSYLRTAQPSYPLENKVHLKAHTGGQLHIRIMRIMGLVSWAEQDLQQAPACKELHVAHFFSQKAVRYEHSNNPFTASWL